MGKLFVTLIACVLISVVSPAFANESGDGDDWEFDLAPFYLWAINIDGDLTIGPVGGSLDVDFSDIYDNLDMAFIVHFEGAYRSKWGFLIDINYLDLSEKESIPNGLTRKVDLDLALAELSGFRRWDNGAHKFDLILGFRYVEVTNDISIVGGSSLADLTEDWLDPIVGGRWTWAFSDAWSLTTRGDLGGFQVGSDFSWMLGAHIQWQPLTWASIIAGYRAIGFDYQDGNSRSRDYFEFDATIHGPMLGINFKW